MATNLEKALISWLEGRGRWLRAGNDALPRYLSAHLNCGPNRLDELTTLLRNPSEVLYVEQTDTGKIRLVGLAAWHDHDEILTDDIPEDLPAAWQLIAVMREQLKQQSVIEEERDTALQLASETESLLQTTLQELAELQGHQCDTATGYENSEPSDELQRLAKRCENLESAARNQKQAMAAKSNELRTSERLRRAAESEARSLRQWFEENAEVLEIVKPLIEMRTNGTSVRVAIMAR